MTFMVDKQLRFQGFLVNLLMKVKSETKYLKSSQKMAKSMRSLSGRVAKGLDCREVQVPRTGGGTIRTRIYMPEEPHFPLPGVLWLHGGGYAIGVPELDHAMYQRLMATSPCIIVAPDYRLSTEAPYPAALNDCYDVLLWMSTQITELGLRSNQLMVGGNSAGGGLTAALTLLARDRAEVNLAFQMPLYPMIDDRMTNPSAVGNTSPVWDSNLNLWAWKLYLGDRFGTEVPAYAAASRATDFSRLPPTATFVGELEPFRDETVAYVKNLREAEVKVDFQVYQGCYHGFDAVCPGAEVSKRALDFLMESYKKATETYFAEQP